MTVPSIRPATSESGALWTPVSRKNSLRKRVPLVTLTATPGELYARTHVVGCQQLATTLHGDLQQPLRALNKSVRLIRLSQVNASPGCPIGNGDSKLSTPVTDEGNELVASQPGSKLGDYKQSDSVTFAEIPLPIIKQDLSIKRFPRFDVKRGTRIVLLSLMLKGNRKRFAQAIKFHLIAIGGSEPCWARLGKVTAKERLQGDTTDPFGESGTALWTPTLMRDDAVGGRAPFVTVLALPACMAITPKRRGAQQSTATGSRNRAKPVCGQRHVASAFTAPPPPEHPLGRCLPLMTESTSPYKLAGHAQIVLAQAVATTRLRKRPQ